MLDFLTRKITKKTPCRLSLLRQIPCKKHLLWQLVCRGDGFFILPVFGREDFKKFNTFARFSKKEVRHSRLDFRTLPHFQTADNKAIARN
ncbi:MAG: hypothetical protein D6714_16565 [Bacteroidetes bacterium]|nr:MAG: hypothetical protein D6714_16565 [Bacteroidota bacterium]